MKGFVGVTDNDLTLLKHDWPNAQGLRRRAWRGDPLKNLSLWSEPGQVFTLLRQNSTFAAKAVTSPEQVTPPFRTGIIGLRQRLWRDRSAFAKGYGATGRPSPKAIESCAIHYEDAPLFRAARLHFWHFRDQTFFATIPSSPRNWGQTLIYWHPAWKLILIEQCRGQFYKKGVRIILNESQPILLLAFLLRW